MAPAELEAKIEELLAGVEAAIELLDDATGTRTAIVEREGMATFFRAAGIDMDADDELEGVVEAAAAELDPEPEPEPEPAVAEPVEVTAELVWEIEVAPE